MAGLGAARRGKGCQYSRRRIGDGASPRALTHGEKRNLTMELIKVRIKGDSPILMHNGRLANPLNEYTKRLKSLTSKKTKTDADHFDIARAEWEGGLYFNDHGPIVTCDNIDACLKAAAKLQKLGKLFGSAVGIVEEFVPLQYKGPRDLDGLWSQKFYDIRGVVIGGKRLQRCRPIFKEWSCEFTVALDERDVNRRQVEQALSEAGRRVGLFDRRPEKGGRFGKFTAEML
jgi:hypothetical protein